MPKLLDANALLRYLLNDNQEQAVVVRDAVLEGADKKMNRLMEEN